MRSEPELGVAGGATVPPIDGMTASMLVEPTTPREAADLLADAAARGLAVAPVGGGTALGLGNPPERLDLALSTARLGGVLEYEPTDLVLSVGAGARLGDVRAVLAEHGQELPIDPPLGAETTIGGLIATALAGPRRLSAGTLRDLLIGIAVAHPSGTVTKAGGMVVKNVTGFDLPRLYHGSLGTLGVVISANFKVLPAPRSEVTIVADAPSAEAAVAAAARVRASRIEPAALDVRWRDGEWITAVRLLGRVATVRTLADETRGLLGGDEATHFGAQSVAWWRGYVDDQAARAEPDAAVVRLTVRPRVTGDLIRDVVAVANEREVELSYLGAAIGVGAVVARLRFGGDDAANRFHMVRDRLLAIADHVVVLAAPPVWKRDLDVWGRPPEALDVMRALKEQFDPGRVLNPGRFAGRI